VRFNYILAIPLSGLIAPDLIAFRVSFSLLIKGFKLKDIGMYFGVAMIWFKELRGWGRGEGNSGRFFMT
jgi:hypothetical protein